MKSILDALKAPLLAACVLSAAGAAAAAEPAKELYLFTWANYVSTAMLQRFEAETGIKVILDSYDSNGALLAKLEAGGGQYDVAMPSQTTLRGLIESGALLKFDAKSLPNFRNVAPPFDSVDGDANREYSIPYSWGMDSWAYNAAKVPGGHLDDTWKTLFEPPPELVGQIAMVKPDALYYAAALYLGIDRCTENPQDAQKILTVLQTQKQAVKTYLGNAGTRDALLNGEVAAAMITNGSYHRGHRTMPSLTFVFPREGTSVWFDNLVIPAKAPHVENARTFLNWMMDPKNAAEAANFTGDGSGIRGASEYLTADLREDPAVNPPPDLAPRLKPMKQCSAAASDLRGRVWTRVER